MNMPMLTFTPPFRCGRTFYSSDRFCKSETDRKCLFGCDSIETAQHVLRECPITAEWLTLTRMKLPSHPDWDATLRTFCSPSEAQYSDAVTKELWKLNSKRYKNLNRTEEKETMTFQKMI
jgi:hypothetical protein